MSNDWIEISAKTVDEAITEGLVRLGTTRVKMEYEVLDKGTSGFLGLIGKRNAIIRARLKSETSVQEVKQTAVEVKKPVKEMRKPEEKKKEKPVFVKEKDEKSEHPEIVKEVKQMPVSFRNQKEEKEPVLRTPASPETVEKAKVNAKKFLDDVFRAMNLNTEINFDFDREENELVIDVKSDDMGILIGKRGQTLDSLQYIISLVINKESEEYVKVKLDSENYRKRRKDTLENLAKNIANKVKRTGKSVSLEPMNSFERRIIHSALQFEEEIETYSEGSDPYRKVVVKLKGEKRNFNSGRYNKNFNGKKPYSKRPYGKSGGYRSYNGGRKYEKREQTNDESAVAEE